jgi:hypothetical protein
MKNNCASIWLFTKVPKVVGQNHKTKRVEIRTKLLEGTGAEPTGDESRAFH